MPTIDDPTEFIRAAMPLCATLDVIALELTAAQVRLSMEWASHLCTSGGLLHGGTVMSLADAAGGACAFMNLPRNATATSTIESKTNFLGAVTAGTIIATARPLHIGNSTIVVETEIHLDERLVAKTTQTQSVLYPRS